MTESSSATAENLAPASCAGLHDTFADSEGEDGLLRAVRRCWASVLGRRMVARGLLKQAYDFFVLVQHELYNLLEGRG